MTAKHTPGPWAYHNTPTPFIYVNAGGLQICQIYTSTAHGQSMGEQFANARLIAAAPELLDALVALLGVAPSKAPGAGLIVGAEEKHANALQAARAAIKKATGGA